MLGSGYSSVDRGHTLHASGSGFDYQKHKMIINITYAIYVHIQVKIVESVVRNTWKLGY